MKCVISCWILGDQQYLPQVTNICGFDMFRSLSFSTHTHPAACCSPETGRHDLAHSVLSPAAMSITVHQVIGELSSTAACTLCYYLFALATCIDCIDHLSLEVKTGSQTQKKGSEIPYTYLRYLTVFIHDVSDYPSICQDSR